MAVRLEVREDATIELLSTIDGKTRFVWYRTMDEAIKRCKEILDTELSTVKAEHSWCRAESRQVFSGDRETKEPSRKNHRVR